MNEALFLRYYLTHQYKCSLETFQVKKQNQFYFVVNQHSKQAWIVLSLLWHKDVT